MSIKMGSVQLPFAAVSEEKIAEEAPFAIAYLKRTNNLDLAEKLGLSTHIQETA